MNNESCKTCRFWIGDCPDNSKSDFGECHRFPPSLAAKVDDGDAIHTFPVIESAMWCGEYQAKEEQQCIPLCNCCNYQLRQHGFLSTRAPFVFVMTCPRCGFEKRCRASDFENFCTCKSHNSSPLCWYCEVRNGASK